METFQEQTSQQPVANLAVREYNIAINTTIASLSWDI